ncbi:MAG TPA: type II 3-dehydroquinate dehydratase [Dehalococcoidia bacterium]|jgi:3-dehydroquinate dehydratase-2|nr:type II 3-dehydroquinate dehydratase [Dehalococcoidia bacterium]
MRILVIHGPNLNILGKRNKVIYGEKTLDEINELVEQQATEIDTEVAVIQANSEGDLVDFIQKESSGADGIIINAGALTHYGLSLRDALLDTNLPVVEVHLSNIYAREEFRQRSVIAPIAKGQVTGLGWRGYIAALRTLVAELRGKAWQ